MTTSPTSPTKLFKWTIPSENNTTFRSGWSSKVKISAPSLPITKTTKQYDPNNPNEILPPLKEGQNPYIITQNFSHIVQLIINKQKKSKESKETQSVSAEKKPKNNKLKRIVLAIDRSFSMKMDENWNDAIQSAMLIAYLLIKNKVINHHVSLDICFFDHECNSYHWVKSINQLKNIFALPENQPNGGTDFATLINQVWKTHNNPPKRPHHHKHHHKHNDSPVSKDSTSPSTSPPKEHQKHHSPTKSKTPNNSPTKKHHHHHTHKDVDTRLFIFTDGAPTDSTENQTEELITEIANSIDDEKRFFITFYQIGNCDVACKFLHLLDHLDEKGAKRDIVDRVSAFSRGESDGHIFSHLLRCCAAFKDMEFDLTDFEKFKN